MVELTQVSLLKIRPNRLNPRIGLNVDKLNELAESIIQVGLLEPLIVRPVGDLFEVVVGERRYRAAQQAGLQKVPVIIRNFSDEQVIELNLIENIQREDLSAVEKGNSCRKLLDEYPEDYPSEKFLGEKIGVSRDTVKSWLALTEAPEEIQRMIAPAQKLGVPRQRGKLDYSTALTITRRIEEPGRQIEVAKKIASLPVHGRQARRVIAKAAEEPEKSIEEIVEMVVDRPCEINFTAADKNLILNGLKTQTTSTVAPDSRIKAGGKVYATLWEPDFADLRVLSVERKRLKYFTEGDAKAEGNYTLEQFKEFWEGKHGEWKQSQLVYVIRFERI